MAAVTVYLSRLREVQDRTVARKMGSHVSMADKATRVAAYSSLALLAVLMKLLVDKGVLSDADLDGAFTAAGGVAFDPEPTEPAASGDL